MNKANICLKNKEDAINNKHDKNKKNIENNEKKASV